MTYHEYRALPPAEKNRLEDEWGTTYPPNQIHHQRGAYVIHDSDDKRPEMIMQIVKYDADGEPLCRYIDEKRDKLAQRRNKTKYMKGLTAKRLHPIEWFGISPPQKEIL